MDNILLSVSFKWNDWRLSERDPKDNTLMSVRYLGEIIEGNPLVPENELSKR